MVDRWWMPWSVVGRSSAVGGRGCRVTGDLFWREESTGETARFLAFKFILSRVLAGTLGGAFGFGGRPRRSGRTLLSTQPLSLSTMD